MQDLEDAISTAQKGVQLISGHDASGPAGLLLLGNMQLLRGTLIQDEAVIADGVARLIRAAKSPTGSVLHRFTAAYRWAQMLRSKNAAASLDGYAAALDLLSQRIWLGQTIAQRHEHVIEAETLANEAAATAISLNRLDLAVEWLERARGIVWGQLSDLRTPMDDFARVVPELARKLAEVSRLLDNAGTRELVVVDELSNQIPMERVAQQHHRWAEERDSLIKQARTIPGFESFLLPKTATQLLKELPCSPIVIINVEVARCDAVILTGDSSTGIKHVPLTGFSHCDAMQLQNDLRRLLSGARSRFQDDRAAAMVSTTGKKTMEDILSKLWSSVVKPIIDSLNIPVGLQSLEFYFNATYRSFHRYQPRQTLLAYGGAQLVHSHSSRFMQRATITSPRSAAKYGTISYPLTLLLSPLYWSGHRHLRNFTVFCPCVNPNLPCTQTCQMPKSRLTSSGTSLLTQLSTIAF